MHLFDRAITVAARDSNLSKAQVTEVELEIQKYYPKLRFIPLWMKTTGDIDQATSLCTLEKTDFFTKEVDAAVIAGKARIAIHSAKDLPDPIPLGLCVIAYTRCIDPSDVLVLRDHEDISTLPYQAKVGTSSLRRIENIRALRSDLCPVDIRGKIEQRLELLQKRKVDAVVIAKAALIRLNLSCHTVPLPGKSAPLQGKLAIVARKADEEMKQMFSILHVMEENLWEKSYI